MTKKTNKNPGEIVPESTERRKDEPSFDDFLAVVRRKMIENGEDPDAPDIGGMDFDDEEEWPWMH